MQLTRSLETYRHEQQLDKPGFAAFLGISLQAYEQLLANPEQIETIIRRQVCERLNVSPYHIKELAPPPTEAQVARILAAYKEANEVGWIACDPETLEPTGEIFRGDGTLLQGPAPEKTQPPEG